MTISLLARAWRYSNDKERLQQQSEQTDIVALFFVIDSCVSMKLPEQNSMNNWHKLAKLTDKFLLVMRRERRHMSAS